MPKQENMKMEDIEELKHDMDVLEEQLTHNHRIDPNLYLEYDVKRGLRDANGKGVLTGLTEISDVSGYALVDGRQIPSEGHLYYQGIDVCDLVKGMEGRKYGFEETIYLLLFGKLPNKKETERFHDVMFELESLSSRFVRDVIMKASNQNIMNAMQRCVLTLYTYDDSPEDISPGNVLRQSMDLIAKLPLIAVYSYHAYRHFRLDETLFIRNPEKGLSLAENILLMLRPDRKYTELEARVLDTALILHAEHGGGNNSSFTTRVVSSSGTDTYSSVAASIGSLKGPRHGGANLKCQKMFDNIKENVKDWSSEAEVTDYLQKILDKKAFDGSGLIYGMGHAVYTLSDPRAVILKENARKMAEEHGMLRKFELFERVEKLSPDVFAKVKNDRKVISANVDFYSGLVYEMLGIPSDLYTPMFAVSRIAGWCAHRIEEMETCGRIMRPAYRSLTHEKQYIPIDERE